MNFITIILLIIPFFLTLIGDVIRYLIAVSLKATANYLQKALFHPGNPKHNNLPSTPGSPEKPFSSAKKINLFFSGSGIINRIINLKITLCRLSKNKLFKKKFPKMPPTQVIYPSPLYIARQIRAFFAGVTITLLFVMLPFTLYTFVRDLPNPRLLKERSIDVSTKIFDRNGILLYEIYAEENRTPKPLTQISRYIRDATIAIEDKDFYKHDGFSIKAIFRAIRETAINKNLQGGSTITQQLIKSALLTPEVSLTRKVKEILLAFWAERLYTKEQILEMYLNQVPYGGTAWGIEAASRTYFNKSVSDVTLAEAALLAGLPQAPSKYSPFTGNTDKAFIRQRQVLEAMVSEGFISNDEAQKALQEPLTFAPQAIEIKAPHFVMYVREYLEKTYGPRLVERGGLRIRTTLDEPLQETVSQTVEKTVASLSGLRVGNGAALVTNPQTGEILAMAGSRNYFDDQNDGNVNVTTRLRQPGSSIKVVTYALALENGMNAASVIDDSPVAYRSPGSPVYTPVNYDGRFHGPVTLRKALANSYNIPAVKTLAKLGVKPLIDQAKLMGIDTWINERQYGLSITLGGADVLMTDLAEVYGTLARGGSRINLVPVLEIIDYTGRKIFSYETPAGIPAVSPATAFIISDILSDNDARKDAFGLNSSLVVPGRTVAVKTGTSNEKRDNWTIGYTPDRLVAVWVGNNDNSPMDPVLTSGITGASPIFNAIMKRITENSPDKPFPVPDSVITVPCYNGKKEYFARGTEPKSGSCPSFHQISPTP